MLSEVYGIYQPSPLCKSRTKFLVLRFMVKDLLARFDTCPDFKKTKLLHVLHTNHSVSSNRDVIKWQNIETQCQYNIDTLMTPCYA